MRNPPSNPSPNLFPLPQAVQGPEGVRLLVLWQPRNLELAQCSG